MLKAPPSHAMIRTAVLFTGLATGLTACSVAVDDGAPARPAADTSAPRRSASSATGNTPTNTPGHGVGATATVTERSDCADGSVSVTNDGSGMEITADCPRVLITADGATVTATAVGELSVAGNDTVVHTDTVDSIGLVGDGNTVTWSQGTPGHVTDLGTGNRTGLGATE